MNQKEWLAETLKEFLARNEALEETLRSILDEAQNPSPRNDGSIGEEYFNKLREVSNAISKAYWLAKNINNEH